MNYSRFTTFTLLIALLISCSKNETMTVVEKDGIKHYQNRNIPADPELKFVTDGKITISGNNEDSLKCFLAATDIEIDDEGNYYIFDPRKQKIFKFDPEGNFMLSFLGRGTGPGETDGAQDIAIVGDSVTVCSPGAARGSVFNTDGNFAYHQAIAMPGLYYGANDTGIGDNEILGFNPILNATEDDVFIGNELVIKNKKYEKQLVLHTIPATLHPSDIEGAKIIFMPFTYYGDNIYFAPDFPENYSIHIKNRKGEMKGIISKYAARIEYNPEEKKHYEESSRFFWNGQRLIPNCKLKSVMNGIYADKYGHLLVWVSQKRKEGIKHNPSLDVFKDGEFMNTVVLKEIEIVESHTPTDMTFGFKKNKLVIYNISENTFSIYDYHYEGIN